MASSLKVATASPVCRPAETADQELVEAFGRGDASAFDRLVARHRARVAALAYRLLGWSGDADDVVQDVFLAAFRGLVRFRGEASLASWLFRITVNTARKHQRRRWLWLRRAAEASASEFAAGTADQPAMTRERFEQVRQAIRALPMRYREVVVLRYLEEMPVAEVAAMLRLTENAVGVRLHRARTRLKERLASLVEEHDG
ncbi:MAG: sigma-70 family RNA polymerase sigma factor [Phycisphaerae bacterium]|nr:sigma-70 family RNA polymerase sigma factor [Phycisphaerae bacterium]